MFGPFEVDLKVHAIIEKDGEVNTVTATYSMPVGRYVTEGDVKRAFDESLAAIRERLGEEFTVRLASRNEFENELIQERTGGVLQERLATKEDWDKPGDVLERKDV